MVSDTNPRGGFAGDTSANVAAGLHATDVPAATAAKRVFFHVGAPKTGTTFLQQVMWHNRQRLARDGVCYPLDHPTAHFTATLDLCQRKWGGRWDPTWNGAWERVAERIREWHGDRAIFSAEIMGLANPQHARRAIESVQPAEVHLVFTCRDLARQLPSDWQEQVKHRHTVTLTSFVDDLVRLGHDAPRPFGEMFWGLHDPIHVLAKWDDLVPPERIHVITVPQPTARADLLWRRFSSVVGIDPDSVSLSVPRDNTAMGATETEFLRRFNVRAGKRLAHEHGPVLNNLVGQRILAGREGKQTIRLPRQFAGWAAERSEQLITQLEASRYDVIGDLAELRPVPPPADEPVIVPEALGADQIDDVAYDLVAALIEEITSLRGQVRVLKERVAQSGRGGPSRPPGQRSAGPRGRGAGHGSAQADRPHRQTPQNADGPETGQPGGAAARQVAGRRQGEKAAGRPMGRHAEQPMPQSGRVRRPRQRPGGRPPGPGDDQPTTHDGE